MDWLVFVAPLLGLAAGGIGFFWSPDGNRKQIGRIGWLLLAMMVVSAGTSIWLLYAKNRNEAALQGELAAQQAREKRSLDWAFSVVGRQQIEKPARQPTFYFGVTVSEEEKPSIAPDFIGPFPKLAAGESGTFTVAIPGDAPGQSYRITPEADGLRLSASGKSGPDYRLTGPLERATLRRIDLRTGALAEPDESGNDSTVGTLLAQSQDYERDYFLFLETRLPLKQLVATLVRDQRYGEVVFNLPGLTQARRDALIAQYRNISPAFVIGLPAPGASGEDARGCVNLIRVPLKMMPDAAERDRLVLAIRPAETEVEKMGEDCSAP